MINQRKRSPVSWPLMVLFFAITISSVIIGILYYNSRKNNLLNEKLLELSSISYLKIRQITQWRQERINDGRFLSDNTLLVSKFSEYLNNPSNQILKKSIIQSLKSLEDNFDYKNALLISNNGDVKLAYPGLDTIIGDHLKPLLSDIIRQRKTILTDLHKASQVSFVHLDLVIPLINKSSSDTTVVGLLTLRIDPAEILYPLLKTWPTPSKSAESLLFRREGDEIVYLNELRHVNNSELTLKKPVVSKQLPAAMALQGITGTLEGIDYRNVQVVAAMNKIPGTSWYMVTKMDREEILSAMTPQVKMIVIILILIIITSGSFLGFIIRNQRVEFYREKYETEVERMALVRHFDYILKYANDIILLIDNEFNIVEANDRALDYYQYSRDEFIGMKIEKLRTPETLSQLPEQFNDIDQKEYAVYETVHRRKDKTTFPIEISSRVVMLEGLKYYQFIGRDITERKRAENTLIDSEQRFRKIFEESPFSILMTGKDFGILRANAAFCNLIGYSEEELKMFTFRNITHPDYIPHDEVSLLMLISGKIPVYHTEKVYIRKDGTIVWASTTVSIIRNNKDEVQFFLVMIEDITSRKRAEANLIAEKEKAQESDRLKTAFLHNVSHEIRTPMNAIIGFSNLLNDSELSEEERNQYIEIISQSGSQLLSIITDIVDIASVESGQAKSNPVEFNLNSSLKSLSEQFSVTGKNKNVTINLETSLSDEDSEIVTDNTKLTQILSNLINNAIKFTRDGRVDFGYVLKGKYLEFYVKDNGIGIPAEYHSRIFDRFYQIDSTVKRQYTGAGLGLSICKGYVELLGGTIVVDSEPGKGTIFKFTIPYFTT